MTFAQIQGNADVCRALVSMVDSGHLPHAIMLCETDGGGAMRIALAFLQYLYCRNRTEHDSCCSCPSCNKVQKLIHPDMQFVFPVNTGLCSDFLDKWRALLRDNPDFSENEFSQALEMEGKSAMIKVDEAKLLISNLSLSAFEKGYKSVLVYLPEKMNGETANRLLKLIEEPPAMTQFVFITHAPEQVLPTISSRCQSFLVRPQGRSEDRLRYSDESENRLVCALMQGLLAKDLYSCLDLADSLAQLGSKEKCNSFCKTMALYLRDIFLLQQGLPELVGAPQAMLPQLRDWAARASKSFPRLALDSLSRARNLIFRNVNLKILFNDLLCRFYVNL